MHTPGGFDYKPLFDQVQALVTKKQLDRDNINPLKSRLNNGTASFDLNFNHTDQEPEYVTIFLDDIGAPDIDLGSVC